MKYAFLIIAAAALQATGNGLLTGNIDASESIVLSFCAFGSSAIIFGLLNQRRRLTATAVPPVNVRVPLLLMNIATALAFIGLYWSYSMFPAPLASATGIAIGPLAVSLIDRLTGGSRRSNGELVVGAVSLGLVLAVATRSISLGTVALDGAFVLGFAIAIAAGALFACIPILSHRLGTTGVGPVRILAHRYHLTYIAAFVILVATPHAAMDTITGPRLPFIACVALVGVALPIFLLQLSMKHVQPVFLALIFSIQPSLTYLAAVVATELRFDAISFLLINASLCVAFGGPLLLHRRERARRVRPTLRPSTTTTA